MAGDSQTGGGGSVVWKVDVDKVDLNPQKTACEDHGSGRYHQRGRDTDGVEGVDNFTISIKIPKGKAAADLLAVMGAADTVSEPGRVVFPLPVEEWQPNQINIRWGGQPIAARGNKILGNAHIAARVVAGGAPAKKAPVKKAAKKKGKKKGKKKVAKKKR
jgi:hypothetical protein